MAFMGVQMDGRTYRVKIIYNTIVRHFEMLSGPNAGTMLDGSIEDDDQSTAFTYSMAIEPDSRYMQDYYDFYSAIVLPDTVHEITVPYNNTTMTYACKIRSGDDTFAGKLGDENQWGGLVVTYRYISPQIEVEE